MTCDTDLTAVTVTRNSIDIETGTDAAATDDPTVPVNNDTCSDTTADSDTVIDNNISFTRFLCQFCYIRSVGSGSKQKRKRQYGTFRKVKIYKMYKWSILIISVEFKFQSNYNIWEDEWIIFGTNSDILR